MAKFSNDENGKYRGTSMDRDNKGKDEIITAEVATLVNSGDSITSENSLYKIKTMCFT